MKRSIRLKEVGVNVNKLCIPVEEYLRNCPRLRKNEMFKLLTNHEGNQVGVVGHESNSKVYLLGGSSVEAMYIKQSERPHSILESLLLQKGYDYEVHNLGASGCQLFNVINLILNKLSNKQGSTVVITLPSNDIGPLRYVDGYFNNHRFHATILPANEKKVKASKEMNLDLYERNLDIIVSLCNILELKLYFTSICYTTTIKELKILNAFSKNYCEKNNIGYVDMEEDQALNSNFFYDKLHFLSLGSRHYSNSIFQVILNDLKNSKSVELSYYNFPIFNELQKEIIWSDLINVNSETKIKLILDLELFDEIKSPMLYAVDYFCEPFNTDLIRSANKNIGYFKYIEGVSKRRVEVITNIYIPQNCTKIKVGLRSWTNQNFIVHSSKLSILNCSV